MPALPGLQSPLAKMATLVVKPADAAICFSLSTGRVRVDCLQAGVHGLGVWVPGARRRPFRTSRSPPPSLGALGSQSVNVVFTVAELHASFSVLRWPAANATGPGSGLLGATRRGSLVQTSPCFIPSTCPPSGASSPPDHPCGTRPPSLLLGDPRWVGVDP